ncbi:MAG: HAMP domain-containing protein, partial [Actinomycetota bacterium]
MIALFVVIKVIPLVALAWFAWTGGSILAERVAQATAEMAQAMKKTTAEVGETMTADAINALDATSREAMERLTTDTAGAVAAFLYDRDGDIRLAASLPQTEQAFRDFLAGRQRFVTDHETWRVNAEGTGWVAAGQKPPQAEVESSAKDNERAFHYRPPEARGIRASKPLFLEMTFVGLDGREKVKVTTSPAMAAELKNVSKRENTFVKAETYFDDLKALRPGEIYVSEMIGAYVPTHMIGTYSPKAAEKKGIAFKPEESAYAGMENPVGRKFQGLVRWATPVVQGGKVAGWVTLALDQAHLRELVDHVVPTPERYSPITDAGSGNYAFIWDYKGRSIVHPRHYFVVGYDPETGDPVPPWLEDKLYDDWQASGLPLKDYLEVAPSFRDQSLSRKPSPELTRKGLVGLDCRYLNFAPQCVGWMDLTKYGGSGSFAIFWSGLWKLTTAATIPYYTGRYADSPRGFGFVTVGANIDDFHRAATEAKDRIDGMVKSREDELNTKRGEVFDMIASHLSDLARKLSVSTFVMSAVVIGIAVWMASLLTRRVTTLVEGIHRFQHGELDYRLPVGTRDEMGELAISLNQMADSVAESVRRLDEARRRAEEV